MIKKIAVERFENKLCDPVCYSSFQENANFEVLELTIQPMVHLCDLGKYFSGHFKNYEVY